MATGETYGGGEGRDLTWLPFSSAYSAVSILSPGVSAVSYSHHNILDIRRFLDLLGIGNGDLARFRNFGSFVR